VAARTAPFESNIGGNTVPNNITPFLWFDNNADEAINFYTSVFPDSEVIDRSDGPDGKLFLATFMLNGQELMALNGGPEFKFTEAISLFVSCQDQAEVDYFWEKLTDGGEESQCGWLKDKFGLSWQIVPTALGELMADPDREKADRVMQAMLKMHKIDIQALEDAYRG
jgi:predicted 3-demethylubiquinone-9 3-methyltransferase (glyoxalase superfamily)